MAMVIRHLRGGGIRHQAGQGLIGGNWIARSISRKIIFAPGSEPEPDLSEPEPGPGPDKLGSENGEREGGTGRSVNGFGFGRGRVPAHNPCNSFSNLARSARKRMSLGFSNNPISARRSRRPVRFSRATRIMARKPHKSRNAAAARPWNQ